MLSIEDGINAAREAFPQMWFDKNKCEELIQCLRKYRYDDNPSETRRKPLHDDTSHAADAFRYLAVGLRQPHAHVIIKPKFSPIAAKHAWMNR